MLDYQIAVIFIFVWLILSVLITGLIETAIKKHKAKKQAFAELEKENKQLKDKLYSLKFQAELRGFKLDI